MTINASDVLVIGGGVIGLTSAVALAEEGLRVRLLSRDPAAATTSAVAGGLCWPYRIRPQADAVRWSVRGYEVLARLAERPEETGARMVSGLMAEAVVPTAHTGADPARPAADAGTATASAARPGGPPAAADASLSAWYEAVPELRRARPDELPRGWTAGWRARTPLVDMRTHLRYLERRLARAGGTVQRRPVTSLAEAAGEAATVVNCSGLGARELVPDPQVHPVQGQLVVVENPGIEEWFVAAEPGSSVTTYVLPQPFGVVLGGTAREGAWSREPDRAVAAAIVGRCARHVPALAGARVLEHKVGLRPGRSAVRLAAERLPGGVLCVHNYGHGGAGVTVAWGCAEEVVRLVREAGAAG